MSQLRTKELAEASEHVLKTVKNIKEASEITKTIDPTAASIAVGLALLGTFMAPTLPPAPQPKTLEV